MNPLNLDDLSQFSGSEQFFRHSFNRAVIYTEGIQYLAENGGAYWLVDAIASHIGTDQFNTAAQIDERIGLIHFWNLAVRADPSALLSAVPDSGERAFIEQEIPFTDFPLDEISVWAANDGTRWTLMLPSEY